MEKMLPLTRRLTFRDKAEVISGGGTGRVLISYELKKVEHSLASVPCSRGWGLI